jgi:cyclophilin family peptidyl-prolyl cis-trans isomerase
MQKGWWAIGIFLVGCAPSSSRRSAGDGGASSPEAGPSRTVQLLEIEDRRINGGVTDDDVGDHDPALRRRAARALGRMANPTTQPLLLKALSDEDDEVVAWGALGLGYICRADGLNAGDIVNALTTRAASLANPAKANPAKALDPNFAIARALGRCASEEAEKTLEAWLAEARPRAQYAALALGDIASRKKALAESTQLALLTAAAGGAAKPPLAEGLYPFGRLEHPLVSAADRLLEIATERLREEGAARIFAVRALSRAPVARTERGAAAELRRVLSNAEAFTPAERAEAARGLSRLGESGQRALAEVLPSLMPARDPVALTALGTSAFGPLLVALETLQKADQPGAKRLLYELAALPVPKDAPSALVRRVIKLRCRAAALLVNGGVEEPMLLQCDPEVGGETGQRAELEVLGRRPIRGKRLALFRALLGSKHIRVREAAIELLLSHPEIDDAAAAISAALATQEPGVVATAAEFVTAHPERLSGSAKHESRATDGSAPVVAGLLPDVANKLKDAIDRNWAPDEIETIGALLEAAGAARLEAALPKLESYCRDANPTLREHAARGLSLIRSAKTTCDPALPAEAAKELGHLATAPIKLELDTDAGTLGLTLDPASAPVAVTRFADLAREGFYNGVVVHRVVPGFVVQFGDTGGDGFGGLGRAPLRCETTPAPFEPLDVGVALAGRDTGSSQMFVTLARYPHLDQEYALVGKATGDWAALAEGDVVRSVKVMP